MHRIDFLAEDMRDLLNEAITGAFQHHVAEINQWAGEFEVGEERAPYRDDVVQMVYDHLEAWGLLGANEEYWRNTWSTLRTQQQVLREVEDNPHLHGWPYRPRHYRRYTL